MFYTVLINIHRVNTNTTGKPGQLRKDPIQEQNVALRSLSFNIMVHMFCINCGT